MPPLEPPRDAAPERFDAPTEPDWRPPALPAARFDALGLPARFEAPGCRPRDTSPARDCDFQLDCPLLRISFERPRSMFVARSLARFELRSTLRLVLRLTSRSMSMSMSLWMPPPNQLKAYAVAAP